MLFICLLLSLELELPKARQAAAEAAAALAEAASKINIAPSPTSARQTDRLTDWHKGRKVEYRSRHIVEANYTVNLVKFKLAAILSSRAGTCCNGGQLAGTDTHFR